MASKDKGRPTNTPAEVSDERLLTAEEVAARFGVRPRSLGRLIAAGIVPEPIRYNRRLVRWKKSEVDEYVAKAGT